MSINKSAKPAAAQPAPAQASKPQAAASQLEPMRRMELQQALSRMGSVAAVFQVRTDNIPNRRFAAFRELMDIYIAASTAGLANGRDYVRQGVELTEDQRKQVDKLVGMIFGASSGEDEEPAT
ncbi:MAG: hypothetical protein FJX35_27625 [Alphaproteobacteria bacterium]|nr:hypothetical protein [Alphaproteobacteria bacterium]